jgi:sugar phosphate isomerase/epimerase
VLDLAGALGAKAAVFGSPKNRLRGDIPATEADEIAAEFFSGLGPVLQRNDVILTLEPNAPAYGADYLIRYADVVRLASLVDSPWIQPQIDTGCLAMVGDDTVAGVRFRAPGHVHVSAPYLGLPPDGMDHTAVADALRSQSYAGWVVLEMLPTGDDPRAAVASAMNWLRRTYGREL